MRTFFSILLIFVTATFALGQGLKPVTREYLAMAESETQGESSLKEIWGLIEYKSKYYSTHNAYLQYGDSLIFSGEIAYQTNRFNQKIWIKAESNFIFFQNYKTQEIGRVIDLKAILMNAEIKQIWAGKEMVERPKSLLELLEKAQEIQKNIPVSIAITKDGNTLFFGTATNTYMYDLKTNECSEIIIGNHHVALSPTNEVVKDSKLIFMMMERSGEGWTPVNDRYLIYDFVTKKFVIEN